MLFWYKARSLYIALGILFNKNVKEASYNQLLLAMQEYSIDPAVFSRIELNTFKDFFLTEIRLPIR